MPVVKTWVYVITLFVVPPALADSAPPAPPSGTDGFNIARLEQIQSETLLLEAKAQRTKAEIAAQGGGSDSTSASPAAVSVPLSSTFPHVTQIAGSGSNLTAHLFMNDGSQVEVVTGQRLAGLTITRITARGVDARQSDGTVVTLPMAE